MSYNLLVDFGASRTKFMLLNQALEECDFFSLASPEADILNDGCFEVNPQKYWDIFAGGLNRVCKYLNNNSLQKVYICSEMHGFVLLDKDNEPCTNYVSWKDQRAMQRLKGEMCYLDVLQNKKLNFRRKTGMHFKAGLPFVNLWCLAQNNNLPKGEIRLCTLIDWLLIKGGESNPKTNITLAAGTGFVNIDVKDWDEDLLNSVFEKQPILPKIVRINEPLGEIFIQDKPLKVFAGTGDMQTSLLGIDIDHSKQLMINLGTGSQVICHGDDNSDAYEVRLGCDDLLYRVVTHIPAGRMLSIYAKLLTFFSEDSTQFWQEWGDLKAEDILVSTPNLDCRLFAGCWGYTQGAGTLNLSEERINNDLLTRLAHSWLLQYQKVIKILDPHSNKEEIVLGGGLAKIAFVSDVLEVLTQRKVIIPKIEYRETVFEGLVKICKTV